MVRIIVTLLLVSASAFTQQIDLKRIDALAAESLRRWGAPGCAIAVVHDGEVIWSKGYGVKVAGESDAVTPRTVFAIGSTTKAFTTAAMGILVDEGRMDWDDPVRKHLPRFLLSDPQATELVTLRDLVSHRTGLSRNDMLWYGSPWSRDQILERISHVRLEKPFRSAWQYQNIMFLAAGQAVAGASGMSWEEFVERRILTPLAMRNTSFTPAVAEKNPDHASPHRKEDGAIHAIPWRNLDNIGPAGSINSNLEDLSQWVKLQLAGGKPLLKEATLREMHTPQMAMRPESWGRNFVDETNQMSYGLAWFIQDYRGHHVVSHGGAIDGFRAQITLLPREKYGIIVLANMGESNLPEAVRWKVADLLLSETPKDWDEFLMARDKAAEAKTQAERTARKKDHVEGTSPSRPIEDYAGEYLEDAYGNARVTVTDGRLRLAWSSYDVPLEHYHYDTFLISKGNLEGFVQFRLNAQAKVAALEMLGRKFQRRKTDGRH